MTAWHRRALVVAAVLALLTGAVLPVAAQLEGAILPVRAAIQELNRSFPGIGDPIRFTFTFTEPTRDSTLGCPLVTGFDLGYGVTPYRITLTYGSVEYVYHASGDGAIVLPCDPKLPIGGPTVPPGRQPFAPTTPAEAAINTFLAAFPERGFPERYRFTFSLPTTDGALGCPLVQRASLSRSVVPYVVTLQSQGVPYVYHVSGDSSIIIPCDPKLL